MNRIASSLIIVFFTLLLASCSHMPQLFWKWPDQGSQQQATASGNTTNQSRKELVVPPSLRGKVTVPIPADIASGQSPQVQKLESKEMPKVAGKYVALDTRVYNQSVAEVFSSVIDAMTELNLPVDSVDSPSGTITTSWVRRDAGSADLFSPVLNMFGAESDFVRYRFVVRVLRLTTPSGVKTQLEIRTLGQSFTNSHWVNKPLKRKVSNDLFGAVEDQLANRTQQPAASTSANTTGSSGATAPATAPAKKPSSDQ